MNENDNSLTTEEFSKKREALENEISAMLDKFQNDYDCTIDSVGVNSTMLMSNEKYLFRVKIKCYL